VQVYRDTHLTLADTHRLTIAYSPIEMALKSIAFQNSSGEGLIKLLRAGCLNRAKITLYYLGTKRRFRSITRPFKQRENFFLRAIVTEAKFVTLRKNRDQAK